ncbi:MAG: hypothetical protein ACI9R3_001027 [Verrucomicrobiales bacterium]|jgi:hypothetical protein
MHTLRLKSTSAILAGITLLATTAPIFAGVKDGMKAGTPALKSIGALAFGPEGILFAADPKGAAIIAIDSSSISANATPTQAAKIEKLDQKIAAALGTDADGITIEDLAVNPVSHAAYVSVSRGKGPDAKPALILISGVKVEPLTLENVKFSSAELSDAPEDKEVGEGRRRQNRRTSSITDMAWIDGKLAVAGLSNEEFASTLRVLDFPFDGTSAASSVEIFHGAHGKMETHSPIRTLLPLDIEGEPNIVASYTCTPLVTIPVKQIKTDAHITGKTIAELGNRNRPLDMIDYKKDGKHFILMANSARGIMKIGTAGMADAATLSERVSDTAGVGYDTIDDWKGVTQLAKLDATQAIIIQSDDAGQHLVPVALP